jgi:hypothetical protein
MKDRDFGIGMNGDPGLSRNLRPCRNWGLLVRLHVVVVGGCRAGVSLRFDVCPWGWGGM